MKNRYAWYGFDRTAMVFPATESSPKTAFPRLCFVQPAWAAGIAAWPGPASCRVVRLRLLAARLQSRLM